MTQATPKLLTFDEFVARYGDNERYELADRLVSPTFPELDLTAEQVFNAGK